MEPKEKALELFDKYYKLLFLRETTKKIAVKCAIIAVDEILKVLTDKWTELEFFTQELADTVDYWNSVKSELNKL